MSNYNFIGIFHMIYKMIFKYAWYIVQIAEYSLVTLVTHSGQWLDRGGGGGAHAEVVCDTITRPTLATTPPCDGTKWWGQDS